MGTKGERVTTARPGPTSGRPNISISRICFDRPIRPIDPMSKKERIVIWQAEKEKSPPTGEPPSAELAAGPGSSNASPVIQTLYRACSPTSIDLDGGVELAYQKTSSNPALRRMGVLLSHILKFLRAERRGSRSWQGSGEVWRPYSHSAGSVHQRA